MDITAFIIGLLGVTFFQYLAIRTDRIFGVVDNGKDVLNQQYLVYRDLYSTMVSVPFNQKVAKETASQLINNLLIEIKKQPDLIDLLSTKLVSWLEYYDKSPMKEKYVYLIQEQISIDFEYIKFKLGYPCHKRDQNNVRNAIFSIILLLITLIYLIYCFFLGGYDKIITFIIFLLILIFPLIIILLLLYLVKNEGYTRLFWGQLRDNKIIFKEFLKKWIARTKSDILKRKQK